MRSTFKRDPDESPIVAGTVTSVKAQVRRADRVSVHLDGSYAFSLPADIATQFGLRKGLELDDGTASSLQRAVAVFDAKRKALDLLSARARSVTELRRALARREPDETVIDEVVHRVLELGYLDDEAYARSYATARARSKGYGPRRIFAELRRRGVTEDLARRAVAEVAEHTDPIEAAMDAARKAWPRYSRETDRRKRQSKLYAFLARRGFDTETIMTVVRRLDQPTP